jgi:hypothetical protein
LSKILKEATTCINWEWWHTSVIQAGWGRRLTGLRPS